MCSTPSLSVIPDLVTMGKHSACSASAEPGRSVVTKAGRGRPVALALGGGSARGFAHIGVLKVIERERLRPDIIVGTSMGAVMGALYAAGYAAVDMERLILDLEPRRLLYLAGPRPSKTAMFDLRGFTDLMRDLLPKDFSELGVMFACVSVDLSTGETVLHHDGDLVAAIRASVSVPVVFKPACADGRLLVDGGIVDPVPVDAARELGAHCVVAVSVSTIARRASEQRSRRRRDADAVLPDPGGRWRIAIEAVDIMERRLAAFALEHADLVIAPRVEEYSQLSFLDGAALIALGETAAEEALPELRNLMR